MKEIVKVNINDIEDIIRAKIEIDKNDKELKGQRSDLSKFINTYCMLTDIILYNNKTIPFKFINNYIFLTEDAHYNIILDILSQIHYTFDNLKEISIQDMLDSNKIDNHYILIHDNKQYLI